MAKRRHRKVSDLTKSEVKAIRRRYAKGNLTQRDLAQEYGLGVSQISRITRGEARTEDGGPLVRRERFKLTKRQVAALRRRYAAGTANQSTLAGEYGLSAAAVSRIVRGITYDGVGGPRVGNGGMPQGRKLTPKQTLAVARSDENMSAAARKYGVTRQAIQALRRRWKNRVAEREDYL